MLCGQYDLRPFDRNDFTMIEGKQKHTDPYQMDRCVGWDIQPGVSFDGAREQRPARGA